MKTQLEGRGWLRLLPGALLLAAALTALGWAAAPPAEAQEAAPAATDATTPLCRFGVNTNHVTSAGGGIESFNTQPLRLGWYIDYHASATPARPNGAEYAPMIRLHQTGADSYVSTPRGSDLLTAIDANPGADWMIGNEPDRREWQDDIEPSVYAKAYHELYTLIKQRDPSARIFAGNIVQATPVRLKYLNLVLQAYRSRYRSAMPVDGWSIHGFPLNEVSCEAASVPDYEQYNQCWGAEIPPGVDDLIGMVFHVRGQNVNEAVQKTADINIFKEQVVAFRQWMLENGYRNTPLYMSEYGVLMPAGRFTPDFPPSRVNAYMTESFNWLLNTTDDKTGYPLDGNRLVQRLSWYSTSDNTEFNGNLFNPTTKARSSMGDNYAGYVAGLTEVADVFPHQLLLNPPVPRAGGVAQNFTVTVKVANSGNSGVAQPVTVRLYRGDPNDGGVQIGAARTVRVAGCGEVGSVQFAWNNVGPGSYELYATVQTTGSVADANPDNNTLRQPLFFVEGRVYLTHIALHNN